MLQKGEDAKKKPIKILRKKNYVGKFANPKDAINLLNNLIRNSYITKHKRKCNHELIAKDVIKYNKQIRTHYSLNDAEHLILNHLSNDAMDNFKDMLFAIKDKDYNNWKPCHLQTAEVFIALVFSNNLPIAKVENSWNGVIEFVPVTRIAKADLLNTGKKLNGSEIIELVKSIKKKPKSLFINNIIVIRELRDLIESTPSLKKLYVVVPLALGSDAFYSLAEHKNVDKKSLDKTHLKYLNQLIALASECKHDFDMQIKLEKRFLKSDVSFVVADLDFSSTKFGVCVFSNPQETLYYKRCYCRVYGENDEYVSQVLNREIRQWFEIEEISKIVKVGKGSSPTLL